MTKEEIEMKIEDIDKRIFYEEMADLNYRFDVVRKLKSERSKLVQQLNVIKEGV